MEKSVAIILVNWNSFEVTNDCILSLGKCSYRDFDIIVVDNHSHDNSGTRLKNDHPHIILLQASDNLGFTGGNNLGFHHSLEQGYKYSMMLNNDTFVEPDFLDHLVDYMEQRPETGAIQPKIFFNHDRSLIWNAGSYFNKWLGFTHSRGHNKPSIPSYDEREQVDWVTGCAFLVRNVVLEKTGILAENMFIYSEDVDLSFRIREAGYQLMYEPGSIIYHIAGVSNKQKVKGKEGFVNPVVHYLNQRNRLWLLKRYTRWYCMPTVILFNFFYLIAVMGYFVLRGRFTKLKAVARAVKDGLSGQIRYDGNR